MAEKCLEMEEHRVPPTIISKKDAPIKENTMVGKDVDLYQIPIMRHHEMDGGPYIVLVDDHQRPKVRASTIVRTTAWK